MLTQLRNFSKSIFAKIFLGIVIIPFVFWGMGSSFFGGNKNVVLTINKEKYSITDFTNFIEKVVPKNRKITSEQIDELLTFFITDILVDKEVESFGIKLSNKSLATLIKNNKEFKRDNKFSRTEYEKFLLKNNIISIEFESNLARQEKKNQLLDFISGGIAPSNFLVNFTFNEINQKREVEILNLNQLFKKKFKLTDGQIKKYYDANLNEFKEIYKNIELVTLSPQNLINGDEYNEIFFDKLDDIDNSIAQGENLNDIIKKYNLKKPYTFILNERGENIKSQKIQELPDGLIKYIFSISETEPTALIELKEKYYIVQVNKTEDIKKNLENPNVRKKIINQLENQNKRKIISEIISKINQNNFLKADFDEVSKEIGVSPKKINLLNRNDEKNLKKDIVNQIYKFAEKRIIVVHDFGFTESYLVYIDKIENVNIDKNSPEFDKYLNLSRNKLSNTLFTSYDNYIKEKYKIDINSIALDTVKNYYN